MNTPDITGTVLMNFANSLGTGYLKLWKANGILGTLGMITDILRDEARLDKYLHNCLAMEGFADRDIRQVREWLKINLKVDA